MKKYIVQWIFLSLIIGFSMYITVALITHTTYHYVFEEFQSVLILIGISLLLASTIISTKIIIDKIDEL